KNVYVKLTVPKNINLYVDEGLNEIKSNEVYKSSVIPYKYGIPIRNAEEFMSFMKASDNYTDRTLSYIITDNINLEKVDAVSPSTTTFTGELNGDYHSISGLKNNMFNSITGSSTKYTVIKNMILTNADFTVANDNVGLFGVGTNNHYYSFKNVYLIDFNLKGNYNIAYFIPKSRAGFRYENCGTSGGNLISGRSNGTLAGIVGWLDGNLGGDGYMKNVMSINTNLSTTYTSGKPDGCGGIAGGLNKGMQLTIENAYVASPVDVPGTPTNTGPVIGSTMANTTLKNVFYDSNIISKNTKFTNKLGTALETKEMIGTTSTLGNALNSEDWVLKEGYYPRLKWVAEQPIAKLYAATRGAFTSVIPDQTSSEDMFNGSISGAIKIPEELQKNAYSIESTDPNILKVTDGGTIIPVGEAGKKATIKITYTEPDETIGGSASNTYDFTVKQTAKALSSVSVEGSTNPGQKLTATASG
ncbi:hypothetical protein MKA54_21230, partial [[Clostridium] innocuum]|nr:hypothetical protein [[Clostridium] innocuum]MCR0527618.1 hypothetical protein [[Clostridium] innocuum]